MAETSPAQGRQARLRLHPGGSSRVHAGARGGGERTPDCPSLPPSDGVRLGRGRDGAGSGAHTIQMTQRRFQAVTSI